MFYFLQLILICILKVLKINLLWILNNYLKILLEIDIISKSIFYVHLVVRGIWR